MSELSIHKCGQTRYECVYVYECVHIDECVYIYACLCIYTYVQRCLHNMSVSIIYTEMWANLSTNVCINMSVSIIYTEMWANLL